MSITPLHCPASTGGETDARAGSALDELRTTGYVILERFVDVGTIDQICLELEPWFAKTPACIGDFYGWNTTRVGSILFKSPASHALLLNETILSIMQQVLGPNCDWYQLNLSQAVRLHPGERCQIPHRDDEMWPCKKQGVEFMVNVMWALDDFTLDNGATLAWPHSHRVAPNRTVEFCEAAAAVMPRGSALIYLGSLTHCGGSNDSDCPRTGLIFSYCLGWLKQYENAFLAYPPHIARAFPKALRDLIGYRIHRPNLGCHEGQDPAVTLEKQSTVLGMVDALPPDMAAELRGYYAARQ